MSVLGEVSGLLLQVLRLVSGFLLQYPTLSLITLCVVLFISSYYLLRPRNLPPGPWGIPWVGSPHLFGDDVHYDFDRLAQKYGPIFTLMMGKRPLIVINTNDLIKEAFVKRADVFSNRPIMYLLDHQGLYDELFNTRYSEGWKEKKKIMTRIHKGAGFGSSIVEPWFYKSLDKMFAEFDKFEGKPFVPKDTVHDMLCITMCGVVFGGRYDYGDPMVRKVRNMAVAWVDAMLRSGMNVGYWSDNVPSWIVKRIFPSMMKEIRRSGEELMDFLTERIHEHRANFNKDKVEDVIDGYISERGDDPELTDVAFSSTLLMLFPDSIDSTGNYFDFLTLYLAYYPDWQRKVQDQIDEVCGDRRPSLSDRSSLSLVEATIYEVGRVGNVVSLSIAHSAQHDTTLEGYHIPEDCYILANHWAAHMEKKYFPQGSKFAPETLINAAGKFIRNPRIMFLGTGRRMCIGEQVVKNEAFLYLSNTLQRYNIRLPQGEPLPSLETQGGMIRAPQPFKICVTPRKRTEE